MKQKYPIITLRFYNRSVDLRGYMNITIFDSVKPDEDFEVYGEEIIQASMDMREHI